MHHGEDEFFDFLRLHFGFSEELGWTEAKFGHLSFGHLAAGVDDQRHGAQGWLLTKPFDEREAVAVGEGEIEDEEVGWPGDALADGLLARGSVIDVDGCVVEAGGEDAGEVFIIFDEQDVGGAFALMEDAAEFGEEEIFVEGFLDPALGVAGKLRTQGGGENAEDNDRNVGGDGVVAETLESLPTAEAGHVEIEKDGFDVMLCREDESLFAGAGFDNGIALAGEVLGDDGADACVVVADQDGAFAAWRELRGNGDVGGSGGAGEHHVERGAGAEVALSPDGATVLLDDAAADGEAQAGAAFLAGVGGLDLLEAVEDGVELVGGDAAAFVDDLEEDGVGGGFGVDTNSGGGGGELDGVGEEIGEDLEDAVGVAIEEEGFGVGGLGDGGWLECEMDGVRVGHGRHGVDGLLGEIAQRAAANLQGSAAGLHTFEVENVVDEADEAIGIGDGDAEEIEGLGVDVADDAGGEKAESAADAGEGSAELVRDGGDELVFECVEFGAMRELKGVLMVLLASLIQLLGEIAVGALNAQKSNEQNCGGGKQREIAK